MRNLMALLMTGEPGDLARIAGVWGVELPPVPKAQQAALLGRELLRDSSGRRLWEAISPSARELAAGFVPVPERRLSELGVGRDDEALRACREAGLLWAFEEAERAGGIPTLALPPVPDPTLVLPPELGRLLGRLLDELAQGDTSGSALQESLERLGTGELENLAAYWGLAAEPGSLTRDELLESLLGRLSHGSTERVAAEAQEPARRLYAALVEAGAPIDTWALGAQLSLSRSALRDAVADLGDRLLALEAYDAARGAWLLYLPQGPDHTPPNGSRRHSPLEPAAAPERHAASPRWAGAWDMLNLVRALELYDVPAGEGGELPDAFVSSFESALVTRPDDAAADAHFLFRCARSLGLAERGGDALKPGPRVRRWTDTALDAQAKRLVEEWRERGAADEDAPLRGAAGYRKGDDTLRRARATLLEHLAACEPETWYRVGDLLGMMERESRHLLRPQNRLVRDLGSAGARSALDTWREVEGRWIAAALRGPLAWLHVVEVEREEGERFRLSVDGAWLCGRTPRPPTPGGEPRRGVGVVGRVRVSAPDARLLWALAGCAKPARAGGRPLYVIDRRSIARARAVGLGPKEVVSTLRRHAGGAVPQKLVAQIEEWGHEPHRLRTRPALLVRCETEAGVEELLGSPIVRACEPRRAGALEVLLSLPHADAETEARTLLRRLERSGLFAAGDG